MSERLTATEWTQVVREFGIGADWSGLQVPAFSGSVPNAAGQAGLAAQTMLQLSASVVFMELACGACYAIDEYTFYLTPTQLRTIGQFAVRFGRDQAELATRQNVQLHWITLEATSGLMTAHAVVKVDDGQVSVAVAPAQRRAATAAAEPPDEPPGTSGALEPRARQGLTTGP